MTSRTPCLSLGWLTVKGAHPIEHIDAAAAGRFNAIGLRLVPPSPGDPLIQVVGDEALIRRIEHKLSSTGISVLDVETVWIGPDLDVPDLRPAMELAQRLGCRNLLTMGNDSDKGRLTETFARLCEEAGRFGLDVGMEFAIYTTVPTLRAACQLIGDANQANGKVLIDALHFARSGGTPDQIQELDPRCLAYCQLADARGPAPEGADALREEARGGRYLPGDGELPLAQLLDALPRGLPIGIEAPCVANANLPVVERGRLAGEATHRFLARADGTPG